MAGLLNAQAPAEQGMKKTTPEQQKVIDTLLKQAVDFLFEEEQAMALVNAAKASSPVEAISQMAVQLLRQQFEAAKRGGKNLEMVDTVLAGRDIAKIMAQILVLAGVIDKSEAEPIAKEAYEKGIALHNQSAEQGA